MLREELQQAAIKRRDHVEVRPSTITEVERVLIRALAITDPEHEEVSKETSYLPEGKTSLSPKASLQT